MGADKRCAASERALQIESAANRNTTENMFAEEFAKSKQMYARNIECGNKNATDLPPDFWRQSRRRLIGPSEINRKRLQNSDKSEKAKRQQKMFTKETLLITNKQYKIRSTLRCWHQC